MCGRSCLAASIIVLFIFSFSVASAMASECSMADPPATLEDLFVDCADASGFSNYFTERMDEDEEFVIVENQAEAFKISTDFSYDADPGTPGIQSSDVHTYCVGLVKYLTLSYIEGESELQQGYAYSYYATANLTALQMKCVQILRFSIKSSTI